MVFSCTKKVSLIQAQVLRTNATITFSNSTTDIFSAAYNATNSVPMQFPHYTVQPFMQPVIKYAQQPIRPVQLQV